MDLGSDFVPFSYGDFTHVIAKAR
ncbi:hypothetical protein YPPY03_2653, partial [Yersinia pestis PY-03]